MTRSPTVAEEIGQTRPFAGPGQEFLVTLIRTTDEVRRYLSAFVESEGITLQQYNVLRILRGAGEDGLPTLEIGRRMLERQPGVTRLVDRLVAKGLVDRSRDTGDRRRVVCTIEEDGLRVLARLDEGMKSLEADVTGAVPQAFMRKVVDAMDALRAHLRSTAPPA
jgi:DNA-binding MarR family transcriptional regulator